MAARPRTGRGGAGRDGAKDVDLEAEILARVIEGLKKADEHHKTCEQLQTDIIELEQEIKNEGSSKSRAWFSQICEFYGFFETAV